MDPNEEQVWIAPLLLERYPFDGIELSGKAGEATAGEISGLLGYLGKDPSEFLVTVGSDTHDNDLEEAGGYRLGSGGVGDRHGGEGDRGRMGPRPAAGRIAEGRRLSGTTYRL